MNAHACLYMTFDAGLGESPPGLSKQHCEVLWRSLHEHERDDKCIQLFEELQCITRAILNNVLGHPRLGSLPTFSPAILSKSSSSYPYISANRLGRFHGSAWRTDLFKYSRPMPVHLTHMRVLRQEDPDTWEALCNGDICVRTPESPFTWLFVGKTLEQEIKKRKAIGGIPGLTRKDDTLSRLLLTQPEVPEADFQNHFTWQSSSGKTNKDRYQFSCD